jgi:hypothetical protein
MQVPSAAISLDRSGHNGGSPGIASNIGMHIGQRHTAIGLANQDPGPVFRSVVDLERNSVLDVLR